MNTRENCFAGQFYPAEKEKLFNLLNSFFSKIKLKQTAEEIIVPHAGYVYSGQTAAKGFARLKKNKTFILLGPNHTGLGANISVSNANYWKTPLGKIAVNKKLAQEIVSLSKDAEFDDLAHAEEHSIEVELPFLQYLFEEFEIVPITIAEQNLEKLQNLGQTLAKLKEKYDFSIITSSDFSHFVSAQQAEKTDKEAIKLINDLKINEFYALVKDKNLSICGFLPIIVTQQYNYYRSTLIKKEIKGKIIDYSNSGEKTGDLSNIVAYYSIIFTK